MKWQTKDKMIGIETNSIESYRLISGHAICAGSWRKELPEVLVINEKIEIMGEDAKNLYTILKNQFLQ